MKTRSQARAEQRQLRSSTKPAAAIVKAAHAAPMRLVSMSRRKIPNMRRKAKGAVPKARRAPADPPAAARQPSHASVAPTSDYGLVPGEAAALAGSETVIIRLDPKRSDADRKHHATAVARFADTTPNAYFPNVHETAILGVDLVVNPKLIKRFENYRSTRPNLTTRLMFHGSSPASISSICRQHFNTSTVFFANVTAMSNWYSVNRSGNAAELQMLVCELIVSKRWVTSAIANTYNTVSQTRLSSVVPRYIVHYKNPAAVHQ